MVLYCSPALVCKGMLAFAIFISHSLQMYVAIDITWNQYLHPKLEKNPHQAIYEYITRTVLVIICCKYKTNCNCNVLFPDFTYTLKNNQYEQHSFTKLEYNVPSLRRFWVLIFLMIYIIDFI